MAEKEITFTEFELVVNNTQIPQLGVFNNKGKDIYNSDEVSYIVDCEIIDEKFFWIYMKYGKAKPYANEVLNTETKEIAQNKREPNEAELRNQLFCMYVPSRAYFICQILEKIHFYLNI